MVTPTPNPSSRLLRAAAAERAELARHRERLESARATLREELKRIEASLDELDERDVLLARIAGPTAEPGAGDENTPGTGDRPGADNSAAGTILRGPAIRRAAVRVLLEHPDRPEAMHYREWLKLVTDAGYVVAGKDPAAVLLTQLSRSPVVKKSTSAGVWTIDLQAPRRLRQRLEELHADLRSLTSTPEQAADLAAIRARRVDITSQTGAVERALEEAEAVLSVRTDQPARVSG